MLTHIVPAEIKYITMQHASTLNNQAVSHRLCRRAAAVSKTDFQQHSIGIPKKVNLNIKK